MHAGAVVSSGSGDGGTGQGPSRPGAADPPPDLRPAGDRTSKDNRNCGMTQPGARKRAGPADAQGDGRGSPAASYRVSAIFRVATPRDVASRAT